MPYYYAMPKVGHLPLVKCSPSPAACPQSNASSRSLAPLVKVHTKLPILAAYPYLAVGYRSGDYWEITICG